MSENYNYSPIFWFETKQLQDALVSYGCECMEVYPINSIKRTFSIKKNKNNIFKNCVKTNHIFSKNMITAFGVDNTQYIYDVDDCFYKNLFT